MQDGHYVCLGSVLGSAFPVVPPTAVPALLSSEHLDPLKHNAVLPAVKAVQNCPSPVVPQPWRQRGSPQCWCCSLTPHTSAAGSPHPSQISTCSQRCFHCPVHPAQVTAPSSTIPLLFLLCWLTAPGHFTDSPPQWPQGSVLIAQYSSRASRAGSALTSPTGGSGLLEQLGILSILPGATAQTPSPCPTEQQAPSYWTARSAVARKQTLLSPDRGFTWHVSPRGPRRGLTCWQKPASASAVGTEPPPHTGQIAPPLFAECSPTGSSGCQQLAVNPPPASYLCTPPARLFAARRQSQAATLRYRLKNTGYKGP